MVRRCTNPRLQCHSLIASSQWSEAWMNSRDLRFECATYGPSWPRVPPRCKLSNMHVQRSRFYKTGVNAHPCTFAKLRGQFCSPRHEEYPKLIYLKNNWSREENLIYRLATWSSSWSCIIDPHPIKSYRSNGASFFIRFYLCNTYWIHLLRLAHGTWNEWHVIWHISDLELKFPPTTAKLTSYIATAATEMLTRWRKVAINNRANVKSRRTLQLFANNWKLVRRWEWEQDLEFYLISVKVKAGI